MGSDTSSAASSGRSRGDCSSHVPFGVLRGRPTHGHHGAVFKRSEPLLTREEVNGLLLLLMSLEAAVQRIAREVAGEEDGEEAD